jgi:tryptophan synthase alpha subunit
VTAISRREETLNGKQKIQQAFTTANADGRAALAMFVTSGFPTLETTVPIIKAVADAGADVIEVGMPFSDPLGEGLTIQKSSHAALLAGTTPQTCFDAIREARAAGVTTPIVLMGYYNPIFACGLGEFCRAAADAGADGLIVQDLPTPEAAPLLDECDRYGLAFIPLVALTSTDESIAASCQRGSGFVYCISVLGVTGVRTQVSDRILGLVSRVRAKTDLPIAVGFGVSTAEHVARIATYADGAAIGSALINAIADGAPEGAAERAGEYVKSLLPGARRKVVAK